MRKYSKKNPITFIWSMILTVFVIIFFPGITQAEENKTVFCDFSALKPPVLLPKDPVITIDKNGNYCHDGQPRFLIGVQHGAIFDRLKSDLSPCEGYPEYMKWIYEKPLHYEAAQRLGIDTVSSFPTQNWIKKNIDPAFIYANTPEEEEKELRQRWEQIHLPFLVDFTCNWRGALVATTNKYRKKYSEDAFNVNGLKGEGNHWTPYNVNHPHGRELYRMIWENGTKEILEAGIHPIAYELFNEPGYNDPSPFNRNLFKFYLEQRYESIAELNRVWGSNYDSFDSIINFKNRQENLGLYIDWNKFMEDSFTDVCREGIACIRKFDPDAHFCVQGLGSYFYRKISQCNVNQYKLSKLLDTIATGTGGGTVIESFGLDAPPEKAICAPSLSRNLLEGMLQRHFYRALADGKPILNNEAYTGKTYDSLNGMLWLEVARGSDAVYLFFWGKRVWDSKWMPRGSAEGGKKVAEKSPWSILNPFAVDPSAISAIMDSKREILKAGDLFVPRNRNIDRPIALLLSFPSQRMAPLFNEKLNDEILTYDGALEFSHYPVDLLLEEQLPEGRASRYKVIVAPGIRNIYPSTAIELRKFIDNGGILIAGLETMPEDEYGHKIDWQGTFDFKIEKTCVHSTGTLKLNIPQYDLLSGKIQARPYCQLTANQDWDTIATIDNIPAIIHRGLGKGHIYFIAAQMPDYSLAATLASILQSHQMNPMGRLLNPETNDMEPNVEMHMAKCGNRTAWFMFNWDNYHKIVMLQAPEINNTTCAIDLFEPAVLPIANGGISVLLPPKKRVVVVVGPKEEILAKYGEMPVLTHTSIQDKITSIKQKKEREKKKSLYRLNLNLVRTLDLRIFCNRDFFDATAGDNQGGWTDQGPDNCLQGIPWGMQTLLGVPCDIIRFDANEYRSCIVMDSEKLKPGYGCKEVRNIPVDEKVKAIYFFHTAAWTVPDAEVMRYRVNYADGGSLEIPVVCGQNIGDWKKLQRIAHIPRLHDMIAWRNIENNGFFCWRWENQFPGKEIKSIDILSASGSPIGIIIGITVEKFESGIAVKPYPVLLAKENSYAKNCSFSLDNNKIVINVSPGNPQWASMLGNFTEIETLSLNDGGWQNSKICFEVNGGTDSFGKHVGEQLLQIKLGGRSQGSVNTVYSNPIRVNTVLPEKYIDGEPDTWQEVQIPLSRFWESNFPEKLTTCVFQLRNPISGVEIRNLHLELPVNEQ